MTTVAKELLEIVDGFSEGMAHGVVDFARLLQQQVGDREWEHILSDPRPRPKLNNFVADALRESLAEPLEPGKL